jgi:hypothetical protein
MKKIYTEMHIAFLRANYPLMKIPELTIAFNATFDTAKTYDQINAVLCRYKIKSGRTVGNPVGTLIAWNPEQAEFLREGYRRLTVPELTIALNTHFSINKRPRQVEAFLKNRRILSGRTGRYPKGSVPMNKGTKGLTGPNRTSFKKGNVPPNRKPLGSERIDSKDGYTLLKVAELDPYTGYPTRFKLKHVHIWEKINGPVPDGMCLAFRDGNKENCVIENLMPVSRTELLLLNQHGYRETPAELKPSIFAIAKLEAKIKKRIFA